MKKRILFVGGDPALCQEFQAQNSGLDAVWETQVAATGEEALALCYKMSFAAVVADVCLTGMTGPDLLDALMRRQPKAMRIILSDMADTENTMKCLGHSHHHLLKPCNAAMLQSALNQAFAQETWLPSEPVQGLIAQMKHVPSPPKIYFQVAEEVKSPHCSIERIADLISQDPAITAKVLQLANSAVFGLQLNVIRPVEAVTYIGLETTKAIVLLAHTFASFDTLKLSGFSVEELWRHSVRTGQFAKRIATIETDSLDIAEQAFAAGLLHDIGKLLFAANHAGVFTKVLRLAKEQHCNLWEAEAQLLPGMGHAELGATVLGIWGLPKTVTEPVALHHCPWRQRHNGFGPVTAVHVANILDHEARPDPAVILPSQINTAYVTELGLQKHIDEWRRQCHSFG
jgi:HD-like signal output (HDOD) protein/CheY-like chemotaxis protein